VIQHTFQQVVSLGSTCRAKHNIKLVFGRHIAPRGVFDWQITPDAALLAYLARDFSGMFEQDDLVIEGDGRVWNGRFGVQHTHEFPRWLSEADLYRLYPRARAKHDEWCKTTRNALDNDLSTLFVLGKPADGDALQELEKILSERCRHKRYLILPAPAVDNDDEWTGDPAVWKRHLSPYQINPPLRTQAQYHMHRVKRNIWHLVPKVLRPA
jgi:hypothetical protein